MRLDRMFRLVTDALATVDELADSGISLHVVDMDVSTFTNRIETRLLGMAQISTFGRMRDGQ